VKAGRSTFTKGKKKKSTGFRGAGKRYYDRVDACMRRIRYEGVIKRRLTKKISPTRADKASRKQVRGCSDDRGAA